MCLGTSRPGLLVDMKGGGSGQSCSLEAGVWASCFTPTFSRMASVNMVAPGLVWLLTLKLKLVKMRINENVKCSIATCASRLPDWTTHFRTFPPWWEVLLDRGGLEKREGDVPGKPRGSALPWTPRQRLALQLLAPPCFQLWIIPSILGSSNLYFLSDDDWETISAWIYGLGLCGLFVVSTVFHTISWKKSHLRYLLPSSWEGEVCRAGGPGPSDEAGCGVCRGILGQQLTFVEHFLPCTGLSTNPVCTATL